MCRRTKILEERASRGLQAVIAAKPDWASKLRSATFTMLTSENCMLGQVFGSFDKGLSALKLQQGPEAIEYGFQLSPKEMAEGWVQPWTQIWQEIVDLARH